MRLFSLLLLAAVLPAQCLAADAAPDPDPLTAVLKRFVAPVPLSKTPQEGRLSQSESDLSMLARGLEAFRHPSHYERVRAILVPNMAEKTRPFFATRESALNALYRTLALIDYTRASNAGASACDASARRDALLRDPDGLFADKDGKLSPWLSSILGIEQAGDAKAALEKASSVTGSREKLRARVLALSNDLETATGEERQAKLCERASDYEALAVLPAGQAGVSLAGLVSDSRNEAVLLLRAGGKVGAAVAVKTPNGTRLLTAAALVKEGDEVALFAADGSSAAAKAERVDAAAGLALLTSNAAPPVTALDESATPEADAIAEAIGHPRTGGAWSRTRGLIGRADKDSFQTDALFDAGSLGGPVFSADGSWLGIAVAPPGAAVTAAAARRWLNGESIAPKLEAGDNGTGSFLTAARLDALDAFAAGGAPPLPAAQELTEASLPDVPPATGHCVAYCESAGPPPPSYASPAPSAPAYYPPPNLNAIFTRAIAEQGTNMLADVMAKGVTNMLNSLFKPRPSRPRPAPIVQRDPQPERFAGAPGTAPEIPPPPKKKQRRPIGMTLTYEPSEPIEGQEITILAVLKFSDGEGTMEGIPVHLELAPSGMLEMADKDTDTDPSGVARFRAIVKEDKTAQARELVELRAREAAGELDVLPEQRNQPREAAESDSVTNAGQAIGAPAQAPRTALPILTKRVTLSAQGSVKDGLGAGVSDGKPVPVYGRIPKECPEGQRWVESVANGNGSPEPRISGPSVGTSEISPADAAIAQSCGEVRLECRGDPKCIAGALAERNLDSEKCARIWAKRGNTWSAPGIDGPSATQPLRRARCLPIGAPSKQARVQQTVFAKPANNEQPETEESGNGDDSESSESKTPTGKEVAKAAAELGFDKRIPPQKAPFDSHGQAVFQKGNRFITRDVDSHKGGVWKMFDRDGQRLGTFDANLNKIGN